MGEFPGDEVSHGDEVLDAAIAAGASACLLKGSIHRFDTAVVFTDLEAVEYARKVLGDGPAEALEGFQLATTGPTEPTLEQGPGLVRCLGGDVDRAQRLLDPPGPCGLEVGALQPVHGLGLLDGPVSRFLVQAPASTLECRFAFDLGTSHLVQSRAAEGDHVKAVKADLGQREVFGGTRLEGDAHVHADMGDRGRLATMFGKVAGELTQGGLVPTRRGKQQTLCVEIIKNSDVRLAAPTSGLIDADRENPGMTFLGACLADMMVDHAPQSAAAHAQQSAGRQHRHGRRQHQRQGLEQQREVTPFARPRHGNLRHLAATGTGHSRHLGMQVGFVLEEIQMAPRARQAVVQRLRARTTGRTGMNGGAKSYLEVDSSGLWLKGDLLYLPRSNKAQSLGEQRFNHEEPVARGKAAIVLRAEGGRLPPSARRKRKRGGGDVKGSAAPGLRPPFTSPPPQTRNTTARSTGNDIDPCFAVSCQHYCGFASLFLAAACRGIASHFVRGCCERKKGKQRRFYYFPPVMVHPIEALPYPYTQLQDLSASCRLA